jgi:hypothetical protein
MALFVAKIDHDLCFDILIYLFAKYKHTHWNTLFITWGPYVAFHGMARKCHIEGSMITAVWTHLWMFLNSKFYYFTFKCWILLKPVLGGVDGNLHFPVPSMNRLNQTEPATFSILPCWAFFRDSVFIYFKQLCYGNIKENTFQTSVNNKLIAAKSILYLCFHHHNNIDTSQI